MSALRISVQAQAQAQDQVPAPGGQHQLARCVADLVTCVEGACRHWNGGRCSWTPPAPERQNRGARIRLGRILS